MLSVLTDLRHILVPLSPRAYPRAFSLCLLPRGYDTLSPLFPPQPPRDMLHQVLLLCPPSPSDLLSCPKVGIRRTRRTRKTLTIHQIQLDPRQSAQVCEILRSGVLG